MLYYPLTCSISLFAALADAHQLLGSRAEHKESPQYKRWQAHKDGLELHLFQYTHAADKYAETVAVLFRCSVYLVFRVQKYKY
jgi:hypothetical protein